MSSKNYLEYYIALNKLSHETKDSHGWVDHNSKLKVNYPPFSVVWVDGRVIVDNVSQDRNCKNIKIGDELLVINGKNAQELWREIQTYIPGGNEGNINDHAMFFLLSSEDTVANYTINHNNSITSVQLSLGSRHVGKKYKLKSTELFNQTNSKNITMYIDVSRATRSEMDTVIDSIHQFENLIIDVRRYPQGFASNLNEWLFKKTPECSAADLNYDFPGRYNYKKSFLMKEKENTKELFKGQLYILIGPGAVSFAETLIMTLQAFPGAITLGLPSAGADGTVARIPMPGKTKVWYTGDWFGYPDKTSIYQTGVKLDHIVKPTIKSITGDDELIDYTLKLISSNYN